ncbi:MAG: type II 3-dehydroquinate dehydratase [Oscillospiraceae bacterium]|nr:type II 3-dehydroquinate dehydratase [Oscillospiraceae bacterium]
MKVYVINGPNMNMLGIREPGIYGNNTYDDLVAYVREQCEENDMEVEFFQSNHEGTLVDIIQDAYQKADAIIINPAAYTHTSIAIHDALSAVGLPTVEVHLSNIDAREEFRKISYVAPVCVKSYVGFGFEGYAKAVRYLKENYFKD